mmetsp:Transcript_10509/g.23875  ORF Transcript_10509/g.23875 Transcript_10509/m.23875 type:complete len:273 (-) Transcript_10509:103-921(-)
MFAGKKLVDLTPEDFAKHEKELLELGRRELQEASADGPLSNKGLSTAELAQKLSEARTADGNRPLTAEEYRQQQAQGGLSQRGENRPPSYEEFLAMYYPHLLQKEQATKQADLARAATEAMQASLRESQVSEADSSLQAVLQDLDRSQMPAVSDPSSDGQLVKTIEHYTFADGEESVQFYISFDKDLWNGATKYITEQCIEVSSKSSSLEIRLLNVPVSERTLDVLATWRLQLSPLFSRVEPSLTTWKVRNGKLSVKLNKSKAGSWKKGVKY